MDAPHGSHLQLEPCGRRRRPDPPAFCTLLLGFHPFIHSSIIHSNGILSMAIIIGIITYVWISHSTFKRPMPSFIRDTSRRL